MSLFPSHLLKDVFPGKLVYCSSNWPNYAESSYTEIFSRVRWALFHCLWVAVLTDDKLPSSDALPLSLLFIVKSALCVYLHSALVSIATLPFSDNSSPVRCSPSQMQNCNISILHMAHQPYVVKTLGTEVSQHNFNGLKLICKYEDTQLFSHALLNEFCTEEGWINTIVSVSGN